VATTSEASDAHRALHASLLPAQTERKHAMTDTKNSADREFMDLAAIEAQYDITPRGDSP